MQKSAETTPAAILSPLLRRKVEIIVIAVSTGGPKALATLLKGLPSEFDVPIVIAQHMPESLTSQLAASLTDMCERAVCEAYHGASIAPGQVWIARGNYHLRINLRRSLPTLALAQGPRVHSVRPAADLLFESAAKAYGANILGVVLTGMGCDGRDGCRKLKESGARVIVQDKASSAVWGMPGAVSEAGLADEVLPLDAIANKIVERVGI